MSVQKILPLLTLNLLFSFSIFLSVLSAAVGAIGGLLAANLLHILAYSCLANLG